MGFIWCIIQVDSRTLNSLTNRQVSWGLQKFTYCSRQHYKPDLYDDKRPSLNHGECKIAT